MTDRPTLTPPEQATGVKNVDHRTDIYALACVAYEMLAGEAPYTGPTAQAIIVKRFSDPVASIRQLRGRSEQKGGDPKGRLPRNS